MTSLWTKFTAWLSGWPEGTKEAKKLKEDDALFVEEKSKSKTKPKKSKKPKGLAPKKKKKRAKND